MTTRYSVPLAQITKKTVKILEDNVVQVLYTHDLNGFREKPPFFIFPLLPSVLGNAALAFVPWEIWFVTTFTFTLMFFQL